jgi:hypothetical protein
MGVFRGCAATQAGRNRGLGARGETSDAKHPVEQALPYAET